LLCIFNDHNPPHFHAKYSGYYGPHTENVFGEIAQIASALPQEQVVEYISTGELPKKSIKKKTKKSNNVENEGPNTRGAETTPNNRNARSAKSSKSSKSLKSAKKK
jgi:hypothetical protein